MSREQIRAIFSKLMGDRTAFQSDAFGVVAREYRAWSVGYYAERLTLAMDRLNESLVGSGQQRVIAKDLLKELFDAAKPPESFDAATADEFVEVLDRVAKSHLEAEQGR